ncbi:MAG: excinuclease ABC subunit UvrC [Beggiatoa sp.]|nr:excinuclease ABC subunit UvrC [Beggiatoa sp.]
MPDGAFDGKALSATLSTHCGVYRMLDGEGTVLYVGKARNLRKRLSSYYRSPARLGAKTAALLAQVRVVEVTVTHTENEALILENNLIKALKPRYNIVLRDDKSYPYIYIAGDQGFPRLCFHRGAHSGKGRYFGPFPSASAVRQSLTLLQKLFLLRSCEDNFFRNRTRPCLQYQIKRCSAPCVGLIDTKSYQEDVANAIMFLEGRDQSVIEHLAARMEGSAATLEFERAARYRDQIGQLQKVRQPQCISSGNGDTDVVACAAREGLCCVQVFFVRGGHNLGNRAYFPDHAAEARATAVLGAFLPQFYLAEHAERSLPPEVLVSHPLANGAVLAEVLSAQAGRKVAIHWRVRGERARFLEMAVQNAELCLSQRLASRSAQRRRLTALQLALRQTAEITRVECFDVSHTQGEAAMASCVVFGAEGPVKSAYRHFGIEGIAPGDDYGALRQALTRHYTRLLREGREPPGVLVIDGGRGQLTQALEVLHALDVRGITVVGIAKGPTRKPGLETLFVGPEMRVLLLAPDTDALHLVQQIRDEAHRFAITGHRRARARDRRISPLERIDGVGHKRRKELLRFFGGLQGVMRAAVEDLCQVPGISTELAARIHRELHASA